MITTITLTFMKYYPKYPNTIKLTYEILEPLEVDQPVNGHHGLPQRVREAAEPESTFTRLLRNIINSLLKDLNSFVY